jgi:cell wall-associated NlpC family hydrolase
VHNIQRYIGLPYEYGNVDCIKLLQTFYSQELGISIDLPSYTFSKRWYYNFTLSEIDEWASKYATKVSLTNIKTYDLIVFKNKNVAQHFGMYITPFKLLHIETNSLSCVKTLNQSDLDSIYGIYRLCGIINT